MLKNNQGHLIVGADAVALVACTNDNPGHVIIIDNSSVRSEAIRYAFRLATILKDHMLWKTFIGFIFPESKSLINAFVTPENFAMLLKNIQSNKIISINSDLSIRNAHSEILNYLEMETGHSSIALIHTANLGSDISKKVVTENMQKQFPVDDENFTTENELILEKRQTALENFHDNIKALVQNETLLIESENNSIQLLDKLKLETDWHIRSDMPLELISREASHVEILAETYYMAHELQNAYENILRLHSDKLTPNHVPLFDTLAKINDGPEKHWNLSFVDVAKTEYPACTIQIKAAIFERVGNFIKRISIEHINTGASTALNIIFGTQAICHWIESGFKPDVRGISSRSLATAIEVHFYVNAVGLIQGIAESGFAVGAIGLKQGMKGALSISALKPFVRMSITLLKMSSSGRILLSLGRFVSKSLPVIGLIINFADFSLNFYQLIQNENSLQRPALITNVVFSATGLVLSIASTAAMIAGFSSVSGPLGIIGIYVALLSIPVSYFVGKFTERIEVAKQIGSIIKTIAKELKYGGYEKNIEHKFLSAPSFVAIKQLDLSVYSLRVTYGGMEYRPSSLQPFNHFFDHFHSDTEYFMNTMQSNIKLDGTFRTLLMPYVPEYISVFSKENVPFSNARNDAEFKEIQYLQTKDPGFEFQTGHLGFGDEIVDELSIYYQKTNINMNILESDWNLVYPWVNVSEADEQKNKESYKNYNEEIKKSLRKISYDIRAKSSGRQTILLPGSECPIDIRLYSQHVNVTWIIDISDQSVSNEDLTIDKEHIKIGNNHNIQHFGQTSMIYIVVPMYHDPKNAYNGKAYFDLVNNCYIYNKDATATEQTNAKLIFSTSEYAYFASIKSNQTSMYIECVRIESKNVIVKYHEIKRYQRYGDGLVFVNNDGVIYHLAVTDLRNQNVEAQIIGFNGDWFDQRQDPSKALNDINSFFEKNAHSPTVYLQLPYHTPESPKSDILYYADKRKYFILNAKCVEHPRKPKFLKLCNVDGSAYFHIYGQNMLISVKGLDINKTSTKLLIDHDKTLVDPNETYEIYLNGVLDSSVADKGVRVRLSCGLILVFYKKLNNNFCVNIETMIVCDEDFAENKADQTISSILERKVAQLEKEHFGPLIPGKVQIEMLNFIDIQYNRENIGYFQHTQKRTISTINFPEWHNITPLGTDDNFAYQIRNSKEFLQTHYITQLKELKRLPENNAEVEAIVLFQAETLEVFDKILFLKKDQIDDDFTNKLNILSKCPQIDLVLFESKNYNLNMSLLENVTISSIDLSESDVTVDIQLQIKHFDGYYIEREQFDLYLYNPKRKCYFIFKGVFKTKSIASLLAGVCLILEDNELAVFNVPKRYNLPTLIYRYKQIKTPLYISDRAFYPRINLTEITTSAETPLEVENVMKMLLWPDEDRKIQLFQTLEWIHQNRNSEKSRIFLNSLKMYPDSFRNLVKQKSYFDNIIHLAVADGRPKIIEFILDVLDKHPGTIKEIVLQGNKDGQTILHYYDKDTENSEVINTLLKGIKEHTGEETLKELILKNNINGETALHYVANLADSSRFSSFWNAIKQYSDKKTIEELILKTNSIDQTVLHILALNKQYPSIRMMCGDVKDILGMEILAKLMIKNDRTEQNVLHYLAYFSDFVIFEAFWEYIQTNLEKENLKEIILKKNSLGQTILNILGGREQTDSVELLLITVGKIFGKETLNELLSNL